MDILLPIINEDKKLSQEDILQILNAFITNNENKFEFINVEQHDYQRLLLKLASYYPGEHESISYKAFNVLRLLSRDRSLVLGIKNIDKLMECVKKVLKLDVNIVLDGCFTQIECVKCLCNWLYHSADIRNSFLENKIWMILLDDLSSGVISERKFYEIRLLFLISALETSSRSTMLDNNVLNVLINVMNKAVVMTGKTDSEKSLSLRVICEILKTLFNVMLESSNELSDDNKETCKKLSCVLRKMIVEFYPFTNLTDEDLLTHIVHMLINIPKDAINVFLDKPDNVSDIQKQEMKENKPIYFEYQNVSYDMTPVIILLGSLSERIEIKNYMSMKDKSLSIFTAFCYVCRINPPIRKYLREQILPPLEPSNLKPEEQPGLRGKIVRLMTTVDVPLKNMAADFLYVLCKENSERLVRYAGYGNSAGFLASRGLMIPGMSHADGEYSADELSDLDEELDPMTGAIPKPIENPLANMSESEKEEEMEKLLCMMDRLKDLNVVKPMAIRKDGKITELKPREEENDED